MHEEIVDASSLRAESPEFSHLVTGIARILVRARGCRWTPDELERRLRDFTSPAVSADLAWDRDPVTGQLQADVLLNLAGTGTLLLAFAADDTQPWVLRGSQHPNSSQLLTVGDQTVMIDEAIVMLEMLWTDPCLSKRVIRYALIQRELRRQQVSVDDHEVAEFAARFRRSKGIFQGADLEAWLAERGLTWDLFWEQMRQLARTYSLLRRQTCEVEARFAVRPTEFERIAYVQWWLENPAEAETLCARLAADGLDRVLGCPRRIGIRPGVMGTLPTLQSAFAGDLPEEVVAAAAAGRQVVGPLRIPDPAIPRRAGRPVIPTRAADNGVSVFWIIGRYEAELDTLTREAIEERLIDEWCDGLLRDVRVEWHWGRPIATPNFASGAAVP